LPNVPLPLPPKTPISELAASGQSILEDLGIFSWFTPPSYLRYALESLHLSLDIPWWLSIIIGMFLFHRILFKRCFTRFFSQYFVAFVDHLRSDLVAKDGCNSKPAQDRIEGVQQAHE
jgi:hypothetical protein